MDVLFLSFGGCGDCLQSIQCGFAAKAQNPYIDFEYVFCVRDEVFDILKKCYGDTILMHQHPEKEAWGERDGWICRNLDTLNKWYPHPNKYIVWPDAIFRNPSSFNFKRFNLSFDTVRKTRTLLNKWKPEKQININLNTTTETYDYKYTSELISELSRLLPDYVIYCPYITNDGKWAGKLNQLQIKNFPKASNIIFELNPSTERWIDMMFKSEYGIYADNGPGNISFMLGQNRLILDPRFNYEAGMIWQARWRQNGLEDSVHIDSSPVEVAKLVYNNLKTPQTLLLPKHQVIIHPDMDWSRFLCFKY